jgi:hypothetical protein
MRNMTPARALSRRANTERTIAFVVGASGIFLMVLGFFFVVVPLSSPSDPGYALYLLIRSGLIGVGVLMVIGAIALGVRAFTYRSDNDLAQMTARVLAPALDDRFTYIRSVNRRGIGYVDAVLVGPPGVLVLRILDNAGIFFNEGPNWLEADPGRGPQAWKPAGIQPTAECFADMKRLDQYLTGRGLARTPVFGVIVFTRPEPQVRLSSREPALPASTFPNLLATLGATYLAQDRQEPARVEQIVRLLFA